jgi:hypothetical protein
MDANFNLGLVNLGSGTYISPFDGTRYVGSDTVCSFAAAEAVCAQVKSDTGLTVEPSLPNTGTFNYLPANAPGGVVLSSDQTNPNAVDLYNMVRTDISPNVDMGNMKAWIDDMARVKNGHFVFSTQYLDPVDGKPDSKLPPFKAPLLQYVAVGV